MLQVGSKLPHENAWGLASGLRRIGIAPVEVAGLPIHPVTLAETLDFIAETADAGQRAVVLYANAHATNIARRNPRFLELLRTASLVFCDGKGVQWASRCLGTPLPQRFTPPDWIDELCAQCTARSHRLFLLGGREGVAAAAAAMLQQKHPDLRIGSHHGYFEKHGPSNRAVIEEIRAFSPHILLVGFGMPLQEKWMADNIDGLEVPVLMNVGALFDHVTGAARRAPRWLTDHGLEWLARLVMDPPRLWRRYLIGNATFVYHVLRQGRRTAVNGKVDA